MRGLRVLLITATALVLTLSVSAADLQTQLEAMAAKHEGKVALFAKNLKTGQSIALNADTPVQTASVIKLPIMLEAFYQVKVGKVHLDDKITLNKDNQVPGSGVLSALQPGLVMTLQDAITLMMILSDNTATNLVIDHIGIPEVNARLAAMGLKNTYLYKKVYKAATGPMPPDQKKFGLGKTTAREMAAVMESIQRCDLKDQALCDKMLSIMRGQQYRNMIPRFIETVDTSEQPSAIADKIGQLDASRDDVALVTIRQIPIIISAFTYENKDQRWNPENEAELLIANMARAIVDSWVPAASTRK